MVLVRIDDAECVRHAIGMFVAHSSDVGFDFQRRPQAETVRDTAWALIGQACGVMVDRSNFVDGIMRGVSGRATVLGRY